MDTQLLLLAFLLVSLVATFRMDETPSTVTIRS